MALRIPTISSCLGCMSLRSGSKFFGFFSLTINLILAFCATFALIHIVSMPSTESTMDVLPITIDLMFESMQITTSFLLLMAAYQEKPSFIPPWLISTVITAIAEVVYITNFHHSFIIYRELSVKWLIITLLGLVDDIYGWLVVYSYYQTLTPQAV